MKYKVLLLPHARFDLIELKNYITKNFSRSIWQASYKKIKDSFHTLRTFPKSGSLLPEIGELNLSQYRQIISGMNRIIYEIRKDVIYIHIICDTRKDMQSLLSRRLLRII